MKGIVEIFVSLIIVCYAFYAEPDEVRQAQCERYAKKLRVSEWTRFTKNYSVVFCFTIQT